ncbi:Na+/H+ antiporter subunit A [Bacillus thermotolerans]|uniref:Na(+) H(+) antiporter subunit A n=1 Tax=Bacillus thermotolerans TaxID=1221996 RepID=A0A0F5I907_BACTR|nr:Na+/H+ antiporter subunit A [Bacillus thermotolerans]KKB40597.1 Na(+) H(+) antiporter subunit A [Bacillus thermotolerans]KKB41933.1 Na(+) H(+) antiporter subunit A [Bacillus thermotolerans]
MSLLHLAIFSPFLMAILVPLFYKGLRKIHTGWFVLILPIVLFVYFLQFLPVTRDNGVFQRSFDWIPSLGISFTAYVDGLSLLFALLITGIGALVVLYSIFYLSKERESLHNFYVYLLMFMGAMLGVVLSDNLITLYMFWELTSISSFLLIAYWYDRDRSRYGALKSMLITVFGGLAMLGGFLLLSIMGDTFSVRELIAQADVLNNHPLFLFAMILILLGAFTKSAQFPFYIWLPDAMEAPTPVSAYLHSATMVKAGIYLVARLSAIFAFSEYWFWLVGGIGIFTLFWGSFNAVKQTDLKGILAFSTVSQLGLIMSLLGAGAIALHFEALDDNIYTAATIAAVFHLINHATFKGSLFMVVGIVDHETGTRDIRRLGGLMSFMPITFTIAIIGAFSMAGLPPFNGFLSKEMFFTGMLQLLSADIFNLETWGLLFPVLAWVGSVFTFIYSMILVFKTFTGKYQPEKLERKPHEAPFGMLISPIVLAALVVLFGLFPNLLSYSLIQPAAAAIMPSIVSAGEVLDVHIYHWHGFSTELFMTIGVVALGILMYLTLNKWIQLYGVFPEKVTLNTLYDTGLYASERGSYNVTKAYMNGSIRTYLIYIFVFFIGILGFTLWNKDAFTVSTDNLAPIGVYEMVLSAVIIAGTMTILAAKSRLTSIIALGAVGYTVSLFFVIFRAPDLALTQLVIETVSVALFLLCFYHLPQLNRDQEGRRFKLGNLAVAIGVGTIVTLMALSAHSTKRFESISEYYIANTYEEAAGKNMVNVILVDFRGFDTLFEIAVLAIAALGIFGMIKLRLSKKGEGADE